MSGVTICVSDRYLSAVLHGFSEVLLPRIECTFYSSIAPFPIEGEMMRSTMPRIKRVLGEAVLECVAIEERNLATADTAAAAAAAATAATSSADHQEDDLISFAGSSSGSSSRNRSGMVLTPNDVTGILRSIVDSTRPLHFEHREDAVRYFERALAAVLNAIYSIMHSKYGYSRKVTSCVSALTALLQDFRCNLPANHHDDDIATIMSENSANEDKEEEEAGDSAAAEEDDLYGAVDAQDFHAKRKRRRTSTESSPITTSTDICSRCDRLQSVLMMLVYVRIRKPAAAAATPARKKRRILF